MQQEFEKVNEKTKKKQHLALTQKCLAGGIETGAASTMAAHWVRSGGLQVADAIAPQFEAVLPLLLGGELLQHSAYSAHGSHTDTS